MQRLLLFGEVVPPSSPLFPLAGGLSELPVENVFPYLSYYEINEVGKEIK